MNLPFHSYAVNVSDSNTRLILHERIFRNIHLKEIESREERHKGFVIIIAGTDLPVSERQLNRIIKRTVTGLSRTGSIITTESGEVAIGFSTATRIPHDQTSQCMSVPMIHEEEIDNAFRAIGKATEEAVLNSLITARHVVGRDGNERPALKDLLEKHTIKR